MKFIAKTPYGLEALLEEELKVIGAKKINRLNRAIEFEGDWRLLYKANVHCRTALRILWPITKFTAHNDRHLYSLTQKFDWSTLLSNDKTFAIDCTANGDRFTHSQFAAQKMKDAIVDQFREKTGQRPSVDVKNPDVQLNLHISDTEVTISLDSSGDSLEKRGYRTESNDAPIGEVLAAGLVMLSGWDANSPFLDPMTGSGTIAIEAAMIHQNIAPGINRSFSFQKWADYDAAMFDEIIQKAKAAIKPCTTRIVARDIDMGAQAIARRNAQRAGVADSIEFDCYDFKKSLPFAESAMVIINPPYGERLEAGNDMEGFYHDIGFQLKHQYANHTAWVISSNLSAMKMLGLKPEQRIKLFNGSLECRYNEYRLFKGKRIEQLTTS